MKNTVKLDPDHDIVLAAALGGRASYLVTYDEDLLDLGKFFGISIVRPSVFASIVLRQP